MVGVDMSTVSRHLAVLKDAGLVEDEKRGLQVYYRVRLGCISRFLDCVESLMKCEAICGKVQTVGNAPPFQEVQKLLV